MSSEEGNNSPHYTATTPNGHYQQLSILNCATAVFSADIQKASPAEGLYRENGRGFFCVFFVFFFEVLPWANFSVLYSTGLPVDPDLHYGIIS